MADISVETAATTDGVLRMLQEGRARKSADRLTLVDAAGNVVARRIAYRGETDYYRDVNQVDPEGCTTVCVSWECRGINACVCVSWGWE